MKIDEIRKQHEFIEWQYGDGYTEPQEWGAGCSCQEVVYDERMQHACADDCPCRTTDPVNLPEAHARHLLGVFIRHRMLRSDEAPASPWLVTVRALPQEILANPVSPEFARGAFDAIREGNGF